MLIYYKIVFITFLLCVLGTILFNNLIKKLILAMLGQTCIILIYILSGYYNFNIHLDDAFYKNVNSVYTDPVPQSLMLTAVVVGLITLAVAFALILKIKKSFLTIESNLIKNDSLY